MASDDAEFLIQVALRDVRLLPLIMAIDRLVILPTTKLELERAMKDLNAVREFFEGRTLPDELRASATAIFVDHAREMARQYRAHQDNN